MTAVQCRADCETRIPGRRYVLRRWQCRNRTTDPTGYCHWHRSRAR